MTNTARIHEVNVTHHTRLALLLIAALAVPARVGAQQTITLAPSTVSGTANTTTTINTVHLPPGTRALDILLKVTAGGAATGTLQLWIEDSADQGATWDDLCSSLTFALGGAAVNQRFFIAGDVVSATITTAASTNTTQGSTTVTETMAAGSARQGPFGDWIRIREKVSGVAGTPTGATYAITVVVR